MPNTHISTLNQKPAPQETTIKFLSQLKLSQFKKEVFPELGNLLQKDFSELRNDQDLIAQINDLEWTMCLNIALYLGMAFEEAHDVVEALLANKKNHVFVPDTRSQMPMHFALMSGSAQLLKQLAQFDSAQVSDANYHGDTPLHYAVCLSFKVHTKIALLKILLETALSQKLNIIDKQNANKETALHLAVQNEDFQITKLLLENGASLDLENMHGKTPMQIAAQQGNQDIAALLLLNGADIQVTDNKGRTLLHLAAKEGHLSFVNWVLKENGALLNAKDNKGKTVLETVRHWYASENISNTLRKRLKSIVLLLRSPETSKKNSNHEMDKDFRFYLKWAEYMAQYKWSKLHSLIQNEEVKLLEYFLEKRLIEIDDQDQHGMTPLHLAAQKGKVESVKLFWEYDANMQKKDDQGRTPLDIAVSQGSCEVEKFLRLNLDELDDESDSDEGMMLSMKAIRM